MTGRNSLPAAIMLNRSRTVSFVIPRRLAHPAQVRTSAPTTQRENIFTLFFSAQARRCSPIPPRGRTHQPRVSPILITASSAFQKDGFHLSKKRSCFGVQRCHQRHAPRAHHQLRQKPSIIHFDHATTPRFVGSSRMSTVNTPRSAQSSRGLGCLGAAGQPRGARPVARHCSTRRVGRTTTASREPGQRSGRADAATRYTIILVGAVCLTAQRWIPILSANSQDGLAVVQDARCVRQAVHPG
jgi:hypothetical protein